MAVLGVIFIVIILIYPTIKFILYLASLGVGGVAYSSAKSSVQRKREDRNNIPVSSDDDWTKEEYNDLVEDPELSAVINYSWEQELKNNRLKEVAINKVNTAGYPEFRAFLLQEIMERKHLATDIMFEYAASQVWMNMKQKRFQPKSYMERAFKRNGDLLTEFKKNNSGSIVPRDFRVIRSETFEGASSEISESIVRENIISASNYDEKPRRSFWDFFKSSLKWSFLVFGIFLILSCFAIM